MTNFLRITQGFFDTVQVLNFVEDKLKAVFLST